MKTTGQLIADLVEKKNITQRELAETVGVTEVTISRYINGARQPKSDILFKIAKALGVPADYFNTSNQSVINNNNDSADKNDLSSLREEFPEGVDVLMRAKEELTPKQKKKMIELMNFFLDSLED